MSECPMTERANARLKAGIEAMIEMAIGGAYEMPDGRKFWMDAPVVHEVTRRVMAALDPTSPKETARAPATDVVERVARAIAEHGFGRPWDDFAQVNAHDTDQNDLLDYAQAAVIAMQAAAPQDVRQQAAVLVERWYRTGTGSGEVVGRPETLIHAIAQALSAVPAGPGSGVYVASRASVQERAAMWRNLRDSGHKITSSWIDEAGEGETADFSDLWQRVGREVAAASKLVLYAEPCDFPLKGALVEAGIAIGMGKPVVLCLPGVDLEHRSCRPIGSWIAHPLVTRDDNLATAMLAQPPAQPIRAGDGGERDIAKLDCVSMIDALFFKATDKASRDAFSEASGVILASIGEPPSRTACMTRIRELTALIAQMRTALEGIDTFAWSAMSADCEEARIECQRRIDACKAAYRRALAIAAGEKVSRWSVINDGPGRWVLQDNHSDDPCPVYETEAAALAALAAAGPEGEK